MANKILVIGSINVDIFNIKPKKSYKGAVCPNSELVDTFILPGGKGANQAAVASWLGAKTYMLGCVGDDEMGNWLLDILKSQGVDVSHVLKNQNIPTSIITIQHQEKHKKYLVSPGANTKITKKYIDDHVDLIRKCDLVLTQLETPKKVVDHIANICNKYNIPIVLNPDPKIEFDKKFFSKFQYLTPNKHEMNDKDIKWMLENTNTNIIQTVGQHGAIWHQKNGANIVFEPKKMKIVSTIGAGDTFSGTLAFGLVNNKPLTKCIKEAIKNSSWSVRQLGAQKLPKKE